MKIAIILASYNGAKYIGDQIRSIQAQSIESWSLFIRDDGSSDDTVARVTALLGDDHRIILVHDDLGTLGPIKNFAELMRIARDGGADYVFLSDQDDVWNPEKLHIFLEEMSRLEKLEGRELPLLIHSDLEVVNNSLETIHPSFMKYVGLSADQSAIGVLLGQNVVTGCACMVNRAVLNLALPVPQGVLMHDWWLALLASSIGRISFIDQPLVRYRQHNGNVLGAEPYLNRIRKFIYTPARWRKNVFVVRQSIIQANLLAERLSSCNVVIQNSVRELINGYGKLLNVSPLRRPFILMKYKIHKQPMLSNLLFIMVVMVL